MKRIFLNLLHQQHKAQVPDYFGAEYTSSLSPHGPLYHSP